jgi:hypothetical protein
MKCSTCFLVVLVFCCSVTTVRAQQNTVALNTTPEKTAVIAPPPRFNNVLKVEEPTRVRGVKLNTHHRRCKRRRIHLFR